MSYSEFYNKGREMVHILSGASIPFKPMMHIPPYFHKTYKSPLFLQILKFPPIFVQFTFFWLHLHFFASHSILPMMHKCIMLYTYWTPLHFVTAKWTNL